MKKKNYEVFVLIIFLLASSLVAYEVFLGAQDGVDFLNSTKLISPISEFFVIIPFFLMTLVGVSLLVLGVLRTGRLHRPSYSQGTKVSHTMIYWGLGLIVVVGVVLCFVVFYKEPCPPYMDCWGEIPYIPPYSIGDY